MQVPMPKKRGGAQPGAGRHAKFTIEQEWVIGGQIHWHLVTRARRRASLLADKEFAAGTSLNQQHAALDKIRREAQLRGISAESALSNQRERIANEIEKAARSRRIRIRRLEWPKAPRKAADGDRALAILAMTRLLRRKGIKVAAKTVKRYLERYRTMQAGLEADSNAVSDNR
jgi:hypothetical protein